MKSPIQKMFNKMGIQVKKYPDKDLVRRLQIIHSLGIDVLFDIGAATGEYGQKMREVGYTKRMVSFEPLQSSFAVMQKAAANDKDWTLCNYALGREAGKALINVAGNYDSSSLLHMLPEHERSEPQSKFIRQEEIEIKTFDSVFNNFFQEGNKPMMKIDVQGFENAVLDGAAASLPAICIIQVEMSLVPLYEGQLLLTDMIRYLNERGFALYSLENGFARHDTGRLLQVDGIFVNEKSMER